MEQMNYASAQAQLNSQKGVANGFATLDGNGLVPSNQLPSYVDDVKEYSSQSAFPISGEIGKIYVATDTNKSYRWSGSTYVELSAYALATQAAAGLMSATDKTKLDGVEAGANNVVVSNSLSDQSTTNALSAAKGYALNSNITNVKSECFNKDLNGFGAGHLTSDSNLNNATLGFHSMNLWEGSSTGQGWPVKTVGYLLHLKLRDNSYIQTIFGDQTFAVRTRTSMSENWGEWVQYAKNSKLNLKTYTALSQIGLTAGTATIDQAFNALTDGSEIVEQVANFADNGYCPYSDSMLRITRFNPYRGSIEAYSKDSNAQCFLPVARRTTPSGNWMELALNDKLSKVNHSTSITAGTLAELETNLFSAVDSVLGQDFIAIRISPQFSSNGFTSGVTYGGYAYNIDKSTGTTRYFSAIISNNICEDMFIGYNNGYWKFSSLSKKIEYSSGGTAPITYVKFGRVVQVTLWGAKDTSSINLPAAEQYTKALLGVGTTIYGYIEYLNGAWANHLDAHESYGSFTYIADS